MPIFGSHAPNIHTCPRERARVMQVRIDVTMQRVCQRFATLVSELLLNLGLKLPGWQFIPDWH